MSTMHEPMEVNAEDLKKKLFHSFREQGHLDSLKSQLRKRLVTELSHRRLIEKFPEPESNLSEKDSLTIRACNSLVADHLKTNSYDFSLSVFLPESGIAEDKLFTVRDIMQLLHIHPQSNLYKQMTNYSGPGFLWQFLSDLASEHHVGKEEKSSQTEGLPMNITFLGDKLELIEKEYEDKTEDPKYTESFENRLLVHEKTIESKAKSTLNNEISRFKSRELEKLRLHEREKMRKEMNAFRKQLESQYQLKIEALAEKDRQTSEGIQKEREIMEKETFIQRQKMLEELDALRVREAEVRRERDIYEKATKMAEEQRRSVEEGLRRREAAVARVEETLEYRLKEQMTSYDIEQKSKYMSRIQSLEVGEARNKEETRLLQEEKVRLAQMRKDISSKIAKAAEVEKELEEIKKNTLTMTKENEIMSAKMEEMTDYRAVKEEAAVLRNELQNTKLTLEEVKLEHKMEKAKYEDQLKGLQEKLSKPSPEMMSLQLELNRTKDQMKDEESLSKQREMHLKTKLQQELDKNKDMHRQLDEKTQEVRLLNDECNNLRSIVSDTQKALSNQVYANPPHAMSVQMLQTVAEDEADIEMDYNDTFSIMNRKSSIHADSIHDINIPHRSTSPNLALDKFLSETRSRFASLEKEADHLDHDYTSYRERITNVHLTPSKQKTPVLKQTSWKDLVDVPAVVEPTSSTSSFKPLHSPLMTTDLSPLAEPMRSSPLKTKHSPSAISKLSPTLKPTVKHDYDVHSEDTTHSDEVSFPLFGTSKGKSVKIKPSLSVMSPRRPAPKSTSSSSVSPKRDNQDPLMVGDTWKSSSLTPDDSYDDSEGAPHFKDFQPSKQPFLDEPDLGKEKVTPISLDSAWKEDTSIVQADLGKEKITPISLDSAWKEDTSTVQADLGKEKVTPVSLDSAWKQDTGATEEMKESAPVSLDSAWKQDMATSVSKPETLQVSEDDDEEDDKWEEERKRKEAEKRRRDQEAWEREQRELESLQKQQKQESTEKVTDIAESKEESDKHGDTLAVEEEKPKEDDDDKIDPVMQKYMQMVQKKKEEEKKQDTANLEEPELSIEDEPEPASFASDSNFDDW